MAFLLGDARELVFLDLCRVLGVKYGLGLFREDWPRSGCKDLVIL